MGLGERAWSALGGLLERSGLSRGHARQGAPEPSRGPHSGHVVGPYEVGALVGSGAVGHVYRAVHVPSGAVVALKIMNRPATSAPASIRFMREVQALRHSASPHVVTMHEWGVTDDGHHFLAMELLEGESLQELLRVHRRIDVNAVVLMVEQVAAGLASAHERGIVHRDIKPSNLFLARSGDDYVWKILDFGLSKFSDSGASSITQRHIVGTPGYLSPEQALGEPIDRRSDVFALATVTYCALTGSAPFSAEDPVGAVYRVVHDQPPAPSRWLPVHEDVELALLVGMAKHVGDRPSSVLAFADLLRAALEGRLLPEVRHHALRIAQVTPWSTFGARDGKSDDAWHTLPTLPSDVMAGHQAFSSSR